MTCDKFLECGVKLDSIWNQLDELAVSLVQTPAVIFRVGTGRCAPLTEEKPAMKF